MNKWLTHIFDEILLWQKAKEKRTLADAADEIRQLCTANGYELDAGERHDRVSGADRAL